MNNEGKSLSVAALILGIVAIVLAWFYLVNIAALACGIVAVILMVVGRKKAGEAASRDGIMVAALVVSIVGVCVACFGFGVFTVRVWVVRRAVYNAGKAIVDNSDAIVDAAGELVGDILGGLLK